MNHLHADFPRLLAEAGLVLHKMVWREDIDRWEAHVFNEASLIMGTGETELHALIDAMRLALS